MKIVGLACVTVVVLCAQAVGSEPQIGDSVVVTSDHAEVTSKNGPLGIAPVGTQFTVKQKSGSWLLGNFHIEGRNAWGWMKPSSVRVVTRDISQQPVHDFTWHNLLLAQAKLDDSFNLEDHVDNYMEAVRNNVWDQFRNDEFQLARKRAETLVILRKRLADFDVERDFLIKTDLTFEEYDFQGARFPIKEAATTYYWYKYADEHTDSLPNHISVYVNDAQLLQGIPMDSATAERFVATRKTRSGYVNRGVYANIRVRITGVRAHGKLEADVRWASIFSDSRRTRQIYVTPQSPLQLEDDSESEPALPSVEKKPLTTTQTSIRQPVVTGVPSYSLPAVQANVPPSLPLALTARAPAVQANSSGSARQPSQQGAS